MIVYIHALRDEGDLFSHPYFRLPSYFYPRPPRGGRRRLFAVWALPWLFLSTPSARRATGLMQHQRCCPKFLSTPSARRATGCTCCICVFGRISIHALREEGDDLILLVTTPGQNFYPRPPRGGRLCAIHVAFGGIKFLSTPSARRATQPGFSQS